MREVRYPREKFDYDPEAGMMRWKEKVKVVDGKEVVTGGGVAGTTDTRGNYRIRMQGELESGVRIMWMWHTGEFVTKVASVEPHTYKFRIEDLYAVHPREGVSKYRAQNKCVVQWCTERQCYKVVYFNSIYRPEVLSYHIDLDDAFTATLRGRDAVSFF